MQKLIDITGQTFNRLTVTSFSHRTPTRKIYWNTICQCGKETKVRGDSLKNGEVKSCGCLALETWLAQKGENNPNWKGGVSSESHLARTCLDYHTWRNSVFDRDNYTCQKCKDSKGGNLNAHHILPFASQKELRYRISNGVTLCVTCHRNFHSKYGLKSYNYYNLIEFINNSTLFTQKDIYNVWK